MKRESLFFPALVVSHTCPRPQKFQSSKNPSGSKKLAGDFLSASFSFFNLFPFFMLVCLNLFLLKSCSISCTPGFKNKMSPSQNATIEVYFNIDLEYYSVLVDIRLKKEIHIDTLVIQHSVDRHLIKKIVFTFRDQKKAIISPRTEIIDCCELPFWVLGIESISSGRITSAFNY